MISAMYEVIAFIGGLLVVVYMYLGLGMGEQISAALPINQTGDFANSKIGGDIWADSTSLIGVVLLMVLIGLAIKSLKNIKNQ